jgi:flavin-dependent dehydrogenase
VTRRALDLLGPALSKDRVTFVTAASAIFTADGSGERASVSLDGDATGAGPRLGIACRRDFDRALLDRALSTGVRHVAERIVDVHADAAEVRLRSASAKYRAALVIGADGANSLVRRRLYRAFDRSQLSIATGFFVLGATSQEARIHCVSQPGGYLWSFPRRDHLAVGICARASGAPASETLRDLTRAWIDQTGIAGNGVTLRPYAWPIPTLSAADLAREPLAGPRWLAVGDAAGLVDSLTREGIYFALKSAECAAEAVLRDAEPSKAYERRIRDGVHPELRRAALFARGFFQPGFTRLLVQALARSRSVRDVMRDLVAGTQPYRGLEWRLLSTLELGLAARLAGLKLGVGSHRAR